MKNLPIFPFNCIINSLHTGTTVTRHTAPKQVSFSLSEQVRTSLLMCIEHTAVKDTILLSAMAQLNLF